ncbi:MAG: hypothetical protein K6357_01160 [Elusimicrobiota bacterium]
MDLNKNKKEIIFLVLNLFFLNLYSQKDFRDESIYFLITDRFVDGDSKNNNIYGDEYVKGNLRYYQGGDFKGLIENLDYIKDMGFTAIWITPPVMQPPGIYVNSSKTYDAAGYHGYWGWDFSKIDPHLETDGYTYKDLIGKAHQKGIKIIQDVVINHAYGADVDISVRWYKDRGKVFGAGKMFNYFNDSENWFTKDGPVLYDLLDFNDKNPKTRKWLIDIYKEYQNMGVDAFRIDTVIWVSSDFIKEFLYEIHKNKKDFFVFGEVWSNSDFDLISSYTHLWDDKEKDMMNASMSVVDMPMSAMGEWGLMEEVFKGGDYSKVIKILSNDYKYRDTTYLVTYLDNHDKPRFNNSKKPAKLENYIDALNFYFTVRGIPCIYYGTEIMMAGDDDPDNRKYFGVEGIKKAKKSFLYKYIKKLNKLRAKSIALRKGRQENIYALEDEFVFKRVFENETVYVFLNKADNKRIIKIDEIEDGKYKDLFSNKKIKIINNHIEIEPHSLIVLKK